MSSLLFDIIENTRGSYKGDLRHYFRVAFYAPNGSNPYHNFRHNVFVLVCCYEGGLCAKLNHDDMRALLIAGIFHDFNHCGKMGYEAEQIKAAKKGVRKHILHKDRKYLKAIDILIESTTWPHAHIDNETESIRIIRDADMCQAVSDVWFQQNIFGLAAEFGITPYEQLVNQVGFLKKLELNSVWGKHNVMPKIKERLAEVEYFVNLLESEP